MRYSKNYGLPYCGSKNSIADDIVDFLPQGDRLVDLFGGGGAITHSAVLSGRYRTVLYNEIHKPTAQFFSDCINGKYSLDTFHPVWITREEFFAQRDTNAYIALCWSFGNDAHSFYCSHKDEEMCKSLFELVVDDKPYMGIRLKSESINDRRLELLKLLNTNKRARLEPIQRLARLEPIQRLARLEPIEITAKDYREYSYQKGDIVYCDVPYESSTNNYSMKFDSEAFYDWAFSRPFQVFFSSYQISDTRFFNVWQKEKRMCLDDNSNKRIEHIYSNMPYNPSPLLI